MGPVAPARTSVRGEPRIQEVDINPAIANEDGLHFVDVQLIADR